MTVDLRPFLLLIVGLIGTWLLVRWLARRSVDATGLEAAVVGVLAGPFAQDLVSASMLRELSPVISFAIGALGLRVGLRLRVDTIRNRPDDTFRITLIIAMVTALLVGSAVYGLLYWNFDAGNVGAATGILTAAALLAAPSIVEELAKRHGASGQITSLVHQVAILSEVLAILALGVVLSVFHVGPDSIGTSRPLVAVEWLALAIAVGVLTGLLFAWFLGTAERAENPLVVTLFAMVLVATGIAYTLSLSPLFVCLVCGITVANSSPVSPLIEDVAVGMWKPLLAILVFVAACAWRPPPFVTWVLIPTVIIMRLGGRWIGGVCARIACSSERDRPTERIGVSLLGQGGIVIAMAVSTWQVYNDAISSTVLTCLLLVGLLNELPSVWVIETTLIDVGDYPAEPPKSDTVEGST
jgi:hypothetical protein